MSFMKKLFSSSKKSSVGGEAPSKEELAAAEKSDKKKKKIQRGHTVDTGALEKRTQDDVVSDKPKEKKTKPRDEKSGHRSGGADAKPKKEREGKKIRSKKKRDKKQAGNIHVNIDEPIEYPCTPEIILEYHRQKPFLSQNEEWLMVELNEFECLVDSLDIIKIVAKHSKFFEVDPDELWEEFFEYVEEMPSYDEVLNYDVWQEFRDEKYPC